jgi:NAD(P)-dependent dehydrogenase (short-subunit alcohol dehydrogenase family)
MLEQSDVTSAEDAAMAVAGARPLLENKVVILTGATGGIGETIAKMLVAAGARIAIADLADYELRQLGAAIGAFARAFDCHSVQAFDDFRHSVETELGPVDGLVNCAGLWAPRPYDEIDEAAWREALAGNLETAFAGCRAVLPGMVERGRGSIVNIASTAGEYGSVSPAAHYAAAKGGVIAMTKSLAREVSPAGVRVNAVSPGPINTAALGAFSKEEKARVGARTLFGRLGHPHEIAGGCVFLLSPLSTFVTGHVLRVNGGSLL